MARLVWNHSIGLRSLVSVLLLVVLPQSVALAATKTLVSEAIAESLEKGTFKQLQQELMMDLYQQQKYEFDEGGVESLGRRLVAAGQHETALEVLQLNQVFHDDSPRAAVAVGDAYQKTGQPMMARHYYERALDLDPANQDARRGLQGSSSGDPDPSMTAMGNWELDAEAMQESMAQMGVEMSPEQMQEMQAAMDRLQQMQVGGSEASARPAAATSASSSQGSQSSAPAHESEFCEVLHRFNAAKKIPEARTRDRVEGEYGEASDTGRLRTWNVETTCGEFLVAVPLWADVSPPIMTPTSGTRFEDSMGGTWDFQFGDDDRAKSVLFTDQSGDTTKMVRLGNPRSFD